MAQNRRIKKPTTRNETQIQWIGLAQLKSFAPKPLTNIDNKVWIGTTTATKFEFERREHMNRIAVTAFVGALLGAIEGGVVFCLVLVLESGEGQMLGGVSGWIVPILIIGLICGAIFGGIIGLVVGLLRARVTKGVAVGSGVGLMVVLVVVLLGFPLDYITMLLVLTAALGGASIGLVTALLTSRAQMTPANDSRIIVDNFRTLR